MMQRIFLKRAAVSAAIIIMLVAFYGDAQTSSTIKGWTKGRGWGWIWGKNDEVGALNAMTPQIVLNALRLVKEGKVYDLGVTYDRTSYKWPGHSPGEVISFRTPEGVKRQKDLPFAVSEANRARVAWHSCALFISDNVGTQIDGLGHVTTGDDNHWYNGFKEADWGGNWGVRKADAVTIPPIVVRGVLIDVAGFKGKPALEGHYRIAPEDLEKTLAWEKVDIRPGDAVFIRTGVLRYWGETGGDHAKLEAHDSAGIDLASAKWLVGSKGAILIGSDTSGLEVNPPPPGSTSFIPVHEYLLIEQGVHIGELHYLEDLARDKAYEFCYIAATNKIKGATAGFTMRPIAIK